MGVILGSVGVWIWLTKQQTKEEQPKTGLLNYVTGSPITPEPSEIPVTLAPLLQSPQKITWQIEIPTLPSQVDSYQGEKQEITTSWVSTILNRLHLTGDINYEKTNGIYYINNDADYSSLQVYQNEHYLSFGKNLHMIPTPTTNKHIDSQTLNQQFNTLLNNLLPLPSDLSYQKYMVTYLTINGENYVTTQDTDANYVAFTYDWNYLGSLIKTKTGPAVSAVYRRDGTLIKLQATIPPLTFNKSASLSTVDKSIIQSEKAEVLDINNVNFLDDFESTLNQVSITTAVLGMVYDSQKGLLMPELIAQGNGVVSGGPITLTLAFPVSK